MHIYVHIYIYMYIYIYTCIYVHICTTPYSGTGEAHPLSFARFSQFVSQLTNGNIQREGGGGGGVWGRVWRAKGFVWFAENRKVKYEFHLSGAQRVDLTEVCFVTHKFWSHTHTPHTHTHTHTHIYTHERVCVIVRACTHTHTLTHSFSLSHTRTQHEHAHRRALGRGKQSLR